MAKLKLVEGESDEYEFWLEICRSCNLEVLLMLRAF